MLTSALGLAFQVDQEFVDLGLTSLSETTKTVFWKANRGYRTQSSAPLSTVVEAGLKKFSAILVS